jgi:hypothetical protein
MLLPRASLIAITHEELQQLLMDRTHVSFRYAVVKLALGHRLLAVVNMFKIMKTCNCLHMSSGSVRQASHYGAEQQVYFQPCY